MTGVLIAVALLAVLAVTALALRRRSRGEPRPAPPELAAQLRRDVEELCAYGPRSTFVPGSLPRAARYLEQELTAAGHRVERQSFPVALDRTTADNVIVELAGAERPHEIVVIGAHYDSVEDGPGADDNASGVAALLALARQYAHARPARTLRLVAFANEEPPHFQTETMGSLQYAQRCEERGETIVAMLSLESLGYYSEARRSQQYPPPLAAFYPTTADFLAFAGNVASGALVFRTVRAFRAATSFPAVAAVLPQVIPEVGWSDQWAFWQFGWPAVMVTDTAFLRNPHYHCPSDRPETLDYDRLAIVTEALGEVVRVLVS